MKVVKPKYYDEFKCIADQCPNSCCIDWKVDVDKKSFQRYRKVSGKIKQKMSECISRNRNKDADDKHYAKIKLDAQGRCSFLNQDNLCEMYIELGEQSMCTVCKTYPRRLYQFGKIYERSLTISCPEVARLVLSQTEPLEFILIDEDLSSLDYCYLKSKKIDLEEQLILSDIRQLFLTILQNRILPIWKRLLFIKKYAININQKILSNTYNENYLKALYIGLNDKRIIETLEQLDINYKVKIKVLDSINYYMIKALKSNDDMNLEELNQFTQKVLTEEVDIEQIEKEFNTFMQEKELIFENYSIYYIYSHYMMNTDVKEDMDIEITFLMIYYALLRYMMQVRWYNQNKQLTQENIEQIIYNFSRAAEHNSSFRKNFKEQDIIQVLKDLNCCSILLR